MPNWCNNNITIEGPKEKIKAIWDKVQADPDKGFFQHLVPAPKELDGTTSPTPQPGWAGYKGPQPVVDGCDNWYDWRVKYWGTKWDISIDDSGLFYEEEGDKAYIKGWYDTAWGPALECFDTFIRKHNDVYVTNLYYEGGMDFAGIYDNGDDSYMEDLSEWCRAVVKGTTSLEDTPELFQRLDDEFELIENRREYIEEEMAEEAEKEAVNG